MQSAFFPFRAAVLLVLGVSGASWAWGDVAADMPPSESVLVAGWGVPAPAGQLEGYRGGFDLVNNDMQLSSSVANNSAVNVVSGSNYIAEGSFSNASGFPMVIQNTGSNVSIQNATIVNLQLK